MTSTSVSDSQREEYGRVIRASGIAGLFMIVVGIVLFSLGFSDSMYQLIFDYVHKSVIAPSVLSFDGAQIILGFVLAFIGSGLVLNWLTSSMRFNTKSENKVDRN